MRYVREILGLRFASLRMTARCKLHKFS